MENEKDTKIISEPAPVEEEQASAPPEEAPEQAEENKQPPKKKTLWTLLMTSGILTLIGLIITVIMGLPDFFTYAKSVSDLKLDLINPDHRYVDMTDTLRIGANNESDDDKYLTEAVVHVTVMRLDDAPIIQSLASVSKNGVNINICNRGWSDLKDVLIEADPDEPSYKNLRHPEKFTLKLNNMRYGQPYVVGELTLDDLKNPIASCAVPLRCKVQGEQEYYKTTCSIGYDSKADKLFRLPEGKGGDTLIHQIKYCIPCDEGEGEYTLPLEYTCPAHKYEEINFIISADHSCYASYYIELYAMDKLLLKTEENDAHFTSYSFDIYSIPDDPDT